MPVHQASIGRVQIAVAQLPVLAQQSSVHQGDGLVWKPQIHGLGPAHEHLVLVELIVEDLSTAVVLVVRADCDADRQWGPRLIKHPIIAPTGVGARIAYPETSPSHCSTRWR